MSETVIRRWRARDDVHDRSSKRHNLNQSTNMVEEELIIGLRQEVGLSFDDITEVMRRCVNPRLSRSAIVRCLHRRGAAARAPEASDAAPRPGRFPDVPCGFIHIDLKHLTRLQGKPSFIFMAVDRATRFAHIEVIPARDAVTVAGCLERFLAAFPHKVHTILTDNGSEFTDRFGGARWTPQGRTPTGNHPFDRVCAAHGIDHRLTKPFHPQTNGMVERFNRRIAEALRTCPAAASNQGKNKFLSHDQRNAFLHTFVANYNKTRLRCLNYTDPISRLLNLAEDNTQAGIHHLSFTLSLNRRFFISITAADAAS
ncbi:MAG: transposase [Alphaproteobacteria bacterium]|nr:MAG: transposase [Alphaproteobacteria bacterium]